jgi:hypothetical protein
MADINLPTLEDYARTHRLPKHVYVLWCYYDATSDDTTAEVHAVYTSKARAIEEMRIWAKYKNKKDIVPALKRDDSCSGGGIQIYWDRNADMMYMIETTRLKS